MNNATKVVSGIALLATIVPSIMMFAGALEHAAVSTAALIGTLVWFLATPLWMGRERRVDATEVEI